MLVCHSVHIKQLIIPPSPLSLCPLQPSHGDKAANPKVLKWMTDLTKIRRQIKGSAITAHFLCALLHVRGACVCECVCLHTPCYMPDSLTLSVLKPLTCVTTLHICCCDTCTCQEFQWLSHAWLPPSRVLVRPCEPTFITSAVDSVG